MSVTAERSPKPAEAPLDMAASVDALHRAVVDWFAAQARDLPWRDPDCSPWGVLVSEVMLQQTPVVRVLPVWREWMERWPHPAALAAEPAGAAVRAWGRLGYPRRALRLHAAASVIASAHDGELPDTEDALLALPGVGGYTAAAVAAFAFGRRASVVDTNIRRVHARLVRGEALPAPTLTAAERRLAEALLPDDDATSVRWNVGVMELGALVCTARSPKCSLCPVSEACAWRAAGEPPPSYVPKGQAWHGTDRQVRGAVMAVLRAASRPVQRGLFERAAAALVEGPTTTPELARLHALEPEPEQLERCLAGLLADGLAVEFPAGLALP